MSKNRIFVLLVLLIFSTLACQTADRLLSGEASTEEQALGEAMTSVAEYISVGSTQTALSELMPTEAPPTSSPIDEATPEAPLPPAILPEVTQTLPMVAQLPSPEPTSEEVATKNACRYEAFLDYETIPYGKEMPFNHKFTKMWRIRNAGNCVWDSYFELMCLKECDSYGAQGAYILANRIIKPGGQVEVRVDLHAPKDKKKLNKIVESTWMIRGGGKVFGIQPDGKTPLTVAVRLTD